MKKILESQKDPRILQGLIESLIEDNQKLRGIIAEVEKEKALKAQAQFNMEERIKLLQRQLYGTSSFYPTFSK